MDPISLQRIQTLHPRLREEATQILTEINEAVNGRAMCRFTFTYRSFSEQADLYAQGRTKAGSIVTNAPAGSSYHNYGLAIDFAFVVDGSKSSWDDKTDFDGDKKSDWMEVVQIFESHGWEWGGRWKSIIDKPHFQKTFGYNIKQLKEKHDRKDFLSGTNYLNL